MPNYSELVALQARHALTLLGGDTWTYNDATHTNSPVLAKVEKDVEVVADTGLSMARADVAHILKADVGRVARGGTLALNGTTYTIQDVVADNGFVIQARVS